MAARAQALRLLEAAIAAGWAIVLALLCAGAAAAAVLPTGFAENNVASGLATPTAMAFAPDGRLFVAQQGGQLRVIKNGALLPTPFLSLDVDSNGERGLLGVAVDPNFSSNGFVYVYYTARTPAVHNRVSRFVSNGDVAVAGSETVLLELNNLSTATNHNGGALHFGPDGNLYIAVGENATPSNSQTLTNLLGKILRIAPDGTIPGDNPFFNTATGVNRAIWALGLRNPFTFAFRRSTGRMFINDVGQNMWEEIDDGIAGSNYGWPRSEGPTSNPGERSPLYAYGHGSGPFLGCAITGGTFYDTAVAQFPASYTGTYFFADFCGDWINRYDPASGAVTTFASGIDAPVDLLVGPDGRLYYLARGNGATTGFVRSIRFVGSKTATTTSVTRSVNPSRLGAGVTFTATVSGSAPTATVSFTVDGGASISGCTAVPLSGAGNTRTAACTTSTLATGTHSIVARYAGDAANNGSTSAPLSQVVNAVPAGYQNVALAANGGVASASSRYSSAFSAAAVNNGDRTGANRWKDATFNTYSDWVEIRFNGSKLVDRVVVYSVQDDYLHPVQPTDMMVTTAWGLVDFSVQGWNGAGWVTLRTVTGNSLVKRTVDFPAFTSDRIRVNITRARDGWSRLAEVEAFGNAAPNANVALASAGGVASASSTLTGYSPTAINNGDRTGAARWKDATFSTFPDWAQVTFNGQKTIDRIIVYSVQDDYLHPVEPTDTMTMRLYGLTDFTVQGWNGAAWVVLASVTGNNLVKRTVSFASFTTNRIRVNITKTGDGYSRIAEIEAWNAD